MLIDEAKILFLSQPAIACSLQFIRRTFCKPENIFIRKTKLESIDNKFLCFLFGTFLNALLNALFDTLFNAPVN